MNWKGKTYWIVGASEGLGRSLAHELSRCGATLVISARNPDRLNELSLELPGPSIAAPLDVSNTASIKAAYRALPPVDGVIYAAAVYEPTSALEWNPSAVEMMCDVNFTGAARVLGVAMPDIVQRGEGHVVMIASLAGLRGLPGAIGYASSKAGLTHLGECIRADLPRDRFKVQVINPGFIESRLTEKNDFNMPYLMTQEDAARRTRRAMESNRFRIDFPKRFAARFWFLSLLPNWLYYRLVSQN